MFDFWDVIRGLTGLLCAYNVVPDFLCPQPGEAQPHLLLENCQNQEHKILVPKVSEVSG